MIHNLERRPLMTSVQEFSSRSLLPGSIFVLALLIFILSPVHQVTDSAYSILLSESLLHHRSFQLDNYAIPRGEPKWFRYYYRNGDIYQIVSDSDRSNHCMGANQNSIGIEHVGSETDSLTAPQAAASAALIRWLLEQYHIPRTNIFGHDFAPGYCRPGGTSCPDKLFGPVHSQSTIAAWVEANV